MSGNKYTVIFISETYNNFGVMFIGLYEECEEYIVDKEGLFLILDNIQAAQIIGTLSNNGILSITKFIENSLIEMETEYENSGIKLMVNESISFKRKPTDRWMNNILKKNIEISKLIRSGDRWIDEIFRVRSFNIH